MTGENLGSFGVTPTNFHGVSSKTTNSFLSSLSGKFGRKLGKSEHDPETCCGFMGKLGHAREYKNAPKFSGVPQGSLVIQGLLRNFKRKIVV